MYGFRNLLDDETLNGAIRNLLAESEKMIPLGRMKILPLAVEILTETHTLIPKHHIYQAGAPQIATCKVSRSNTLVSADKQLLDAARVESIEAFNIEKDAETIRNRLY